MNSKNSWLDFEILGLFAFVASLVGLASTSILDDFDIFGSFGVDVHGLFLFEFGPSGELGFVVD